MKKITREAIHYVILSVILTATVFIAHFTSQAIGLMDSLLASSGITRAFYWVVLFIFYVIIVGVVLTIVDLILHKTLRI